MSTAFLLPLTRVASFAFAKTRLTTILEIYDFRLHLGLASLAMHETVKFLRREYIEYVNFL